MQVLSVKVLRVSLRLDSMMALGAVVGIVDSADIGWVVVVEDFSLGVGLA